MIYVALFLAGLLLGLMVAAGVFLRGWRQRETSEADVEILLRLKAIEDAEHAEDLKS